MKKLLKSMFNNTATLQAAENGKDEDLFNEASFLNTGNNTGIEVEELSFEDYIRVMKTQEKAILL